MKKTLLALALAVAAGGAQAVDVDPVKFTLAALLEGGTASPPVTSCSATGTDNTGPFV
jgi:hypothetical protein